MPLLMIVKRGKKLGSFLKGDGYRFISDLGYEQDRPFALDPSTFSGYVLVSVSHLHVPELKTVNGMVLADAVPALIQNRVLLNSDQVDYYLAIKPTERTLTQNITELDFTALWIDHEVLSQDLDAVSFVPAPIQTRSIYQQLSAALNVPMSVMSFNIPNTNKYVTDKPVSISSSIWNQVQVVETNLKSTPMEVSASSWGLSGVYDSDTPVLLPVSTYKVEVDTVSDTPVLLPNNIVAYTLRWLPPIPVRTQETWYQNQMYESTSTAVVNFVQFFTQDLEAQTPKPLPVFKSGYVNSDKLQVDRPAPVRSKIFNTLIKVEVLPNLTGSVTTQAYSNYSIILQPTTVPSVTLTQNQTPTSMLVLDSTFSTSTWNVQTPNGVLAWADMQPVVSGSKSSTFGAPIADGLISNYDVGHAASYFGTGVTWKDLIGLNHITFTDMFYRSAYDGGLLDAGIGYGLAANPANFNLTSALTLEAVIRPTALANATHGMGIISKGTSTDGSSASYELMLVQSGSKNYLYFRVYIAGQVTVSPKLIPIELSTNYYVSATYDGAKLRVFVNSVEDGTGVAASGNLQTNAGALCVGSRFLQKGTGSTSGFQGTIYSARVYGRALSQGEIATNFNNVRARYGI